MTNCGYGSNLTIDGCVETDASIMDGRTLNFGGCGAVKNVKNPIDLAYNICVNQSAPSPYGLIPPCLLVGKGALEYAKSQSLKIVTQKSLISPKALTQHKKYKKLVDPNSEVLLDTVGAVCIDTKGDVAAGCSSGGILLKKGGRVGQGAVYASGVWADNYDPENENSVAICTSGCGEHLIKTQLAKSVAEDVKNCNCITTGLSESITRNFLSTDQILLFFFAYLSVPDSRFLNNIPSKLCGALVLHSDNKTKDLSLLWAHTTETMSIGFMRSNENPKVSVTKIINKKLIIYSIQAIISELPSDIPIGVKVNVSGVFFQRNN